MALTHNQKAVGDSSTSSANAAAITVGGSGSALFVSCAWQGSNAVTVNDNNGGGYTLIGSAQVGTGGLSGWRFQSAIEPSPASGSTTVTVASTSATRMFVCVLEARGFTGTPTVDDFAYNEDALTPHVTGTIDTTVASAILYVVMYPNTFVVSVDSPYTQIAANDAGFGGGAEGYRIVTSTVAAESCPYTNSDSSQTIAILAAIADVTGAITKTGAGIVGP